MLCVHDERFSGLVVYRVEDRNPGLLADDGKAHAAESRPGQYAAI